MSGRDELLTKIAQNNRRRALLACEMDKKVIEIVKGTREDRVSKILGLYEQVSDNVGSHLKQLTDAVK